MEAFLEKPTRMHSSAAAFEAPVVVDELGRS
jgi:hypothetical protein